MKSPVLQPNPAGGRELTPEFYKEQIQYIEDYVSSCTPGRGLLPVGSQRRQPLASLIPPNVIQLEAIHAIGENGYLLSSGQTGRSGDIEPFDVQCLATGCHQIYVCQAFDKMPCGEPLEIYPETTTAKHAWVERHLGCQLVLAADDNRFKYRDWLQVAEVWRVRESGIIRTQLNDRFHPVITSMKAYCLPDPIQPFTAYVFNMLDVIQDSQTVEQLKIELALLALIADEGSPSQVFLQAQRCLGHMDCLPEPIRGMSRALNSFCYSPHSFCEFLASLRDMCNAEHRDRYPDILRIDGQSYYRLPGEIIEADEFWVWKPDRANFVVNSLAIYLPAVQPGTVPNVRFGQYARDQGQFPVASHAKSISSSGSAIVMEQFDGEINSLYLAVDAIGLQQRFRMQLGEGHAIYYF